jgi:hypothetical protein
MLLMLALVFFHSAVAQAASLKNSEFLKFSEGQRHWWYLGAFTSLGHVAMLEDKEKGQCVLRWLFDEGENRKSRLDATLAKYPDLTPTSIVIATLRRDCGVFLEKKQPGK